MFAELAGEEVPWAQVVIYQVDERVAPDGDPARNLTHLRASLGDAPAEVRAMPVGARPGGGGRRVRRALLPDRFDLIHLGLGPDGHTASLVPGDPVLDVTDRLVAVTAPYQEHRRMTLTYPAPRPRRPALWLVTGEDKRRPLAQVLAGDPSVPGGRVVAAVARSLRHRGRRGRRMSRPLASRSGCVGATDRRPTPSRRGIARPDDHVIVMFRATGDLASASSCPASSTSRRPACSPALPHHRLGACRVRDDRRRVPRSPRDAVRQFGRMKPTGGAWKKFVSLLSFATLTRMTPRRCSPPWPRRRTKWDADRARLYHLAIPPVANSMIRLLGRTGLAEREAGHHRNPLGPICLGSGPERHRACGVRRVAGLPHRPLLGEGVGRQHPGLPVRQRPVRADLEPDHLRYVQIDVPESLTIEGRAASTRDRRFRDMVVTHLFQVLGFVGMEPPTSLAASRCGTRRSRCSRPCNRSTYATSCASDTAATGRSPVRPRRTPKRSWR